MYINIIPVINIKTKSSDLNSRQIATYIYSNQIQLQAGRYFSESDSCNVLHT